MEASNEHSYRHSHRRPDGIRDLAPWALLRGAAPAQPVRRGCSGRRARVRPARRAAGAAAAPAVSRRALSERRSGLRARRLTTSADSRLWTWTYQAGHRRLGQGSVRGGGARGAAPRGRARGRAAARVGAARRAAARAAAHAPAAPARGSANRLDAHASRSQRPDALPGPGTTGPAGHVTATAQ